MILPEMTARLADKRSTSRRRAEHFVDDHLERQRAFAALARGIPPPRLTKRALALVFEHVLKRGARP
jgi:hypothetical protein